MIEEKENKKSEFKIKKFLFPFFPIKTFRSTRLLFLIAILIALRVVLGFASIKIAPFSLTISISWLPVMLIGWYFGPIVGLFMGWITDTVSFFVGGGGIWFWLYAIQEPIVGLIGGLIGSLCRIRINSKKPLIDLIINQIIIVAFVVITYVALILWLDPSIEFEGHKEEYEKFYQIYKWVIVGGLSLLFIVYEVLILHFYFKKKKNDDKHVLINFFYSSCLVICIALLFSIILGPITAVEYLKFIGMQLPSDYLKFGSLFYLVPRFAVEAIKIPVETLCLFGVVCLFDKNIEIVVNKINNSW